MMFMSSTPASFKPALALGIRVSTLQCDQQGPWGAPWMLSSLTLSILPRRDPLAGLRVVTACVTSWLSPRHFTPDFLKY